MEIEVDPHAYQAPAIVDPKDVHSFLYPSIEDSILSDSFRDRRIGVMTKAYMNEFADENFRLARVEELIRQLQAVDHFIYSSPQFDYKDVSGSIVGRRLMDKINYEQELLIDEIVSICLACYHKQSSIVPIIQETIQKTKWQSFSGNSVFGKIEDGVMKVVRERAEKLAQIFIRTGFKTREQIEELFSQV